MASTYMSEYQRTYKNLNPLVTHSTDVSPEDVSSNSAVTSNEITWERYLSTESPRFEYTPRARLASEETSGFCRTSEPFSSAKCTRGNLAQPSEIDRELKEAETKEKGARIKIYRDAATETVNTTGTQTPLQPVYRASNYRQKLQAAKEANYRRKPQSIGFYLK